MKKLLFILLLLLLIIPLRTNSHSRKTNKQIIRDLGFGGHQITLADSIRFTIYPRSQRKLYDTPNF